MSRAVREITILLKPFTTDFAEDKDAAASIRENQVRPALAAGGRVTLDFNGVRVATQSFIHALISDVLRRSGESILDRITFRRCSKAVRGIIETVVQYSLESLEADDKDTVSGGLDKQVPSPRKSRLVKETVRRRK
jgi:hypothetical protein